ncbi:MAG: hypothetical protein U5K81_11120 [Trueperaceae bacterium]|nr:hypothetical protein [Trueperaceae bacterium]
MTIVRSFAVGLLAVLALSAAWAQEAPPEDDVLQRYGLATENLAVAVATLQDDAAASRNALDQAFSALLTLSRGSSSSLTESLDRVFERARTAIDNRSHTDLAVQTAVLRGGFQRLLYESALSAAVSGEEALARARLLRLADDLGLGEARLEQLEQRAEPGPLRRVLEAGVAEQVGARLTALAEQAPPSDRDAAYRTLAEAYGDYLLVQDSSRVDPQSNRRFVEAAGALVDGDAETYASRLATLGEDLRALQTAADEGATPEAGPETDGGAVAELPSEQAPAAQDAPEEEAPAEEEAPVEGEGVAQEDAPPEDAGQDQATQEDGAVQDAEAQAPPPEGAPEDGEAAPAEVSDIDPAVRAQVATELEAERAADARRALDEDLAAFDLADGPREDLVRQLYEAGVRSVSEVEQDLAALANRVSAHVLRGEPRMARARLRELEAQYRTSLQPVTRRAAADADDALMALLERLDRAPSLRASDAALLASELQAVSDRLRGGVVPSSHVLVDTASDAWSGPIRPAAMIVLALLALIPLRLLDLAFGGANRNWRLIGTALLFLFIPIYYEGIAAAGALLASPLGVPALASLTAWSVFQNDLTQMVWGVLTLLALLLATAGLYGICVQFGVVGRKRRATPARDTSTKTGDDTLVDWDDDF